MIAKTREAPAQASGVIRSDPRRELLEHALESAAHLLPAQGPITQFIHHNTLHAFEELPFEEALKRGADIFGAQTYLDESHFRRELSRLRIHHSDVAAVLNEDLGDESADPICPAAPFLGSRFQLRRAMLEHSMHTGSPAELRWFVAETDALRKFRAEASPERRVRLTDDTREWVMRDLLRKRLASAGSKEVDEEHLMSLFDAGDLSAVDRWSTETWTRLTLKALWQVCRKGMQGVASTASRRPRVRRHRDMLLAATGVDSDQLVNDLLIRFSAAYLDQGLGAWQLPHREEGFFKSFAALYGDGRPVESWLASLPRELQRVVESGMTPLDLIQESLDALGVAPTEWESYLSATLLSLRGWAGMIRQVEMRGDKVVHPAAANSLVEFAAIRLLLDRLAVAAVAREALGEGVALADLRSLLTKRLGKRKATVDQRAFRIFELAQVMGWTPRELHSLSKSHWQTLAKEIEDFSSWERRRIYQLCYERRHRIATLDAVSAHPRAENAATRPQFQAVFCIDEREESFRRHLEELAPRAQTFGAVGFFGVAMYYRGAADAHFVPLCPVVIVPQHWVVEKPAYTLEKQHQRRASARRLLGSASHYVHVISRSFFGGALTAAMGVAASLPLVARVLFPRHTARVRRQVGRFVELPAMTQLQIERSTPQPAPQNGAIGYSVQEMGRIVEQLLRDIGLTSNFSRLIYIVGHGSSSLNNPHEPAHDCGACGGARGGPNARVFARMANDPRVRRILADRGIALPHDVIFIGAYHNTCDESVAYFDLDQLPATHREELEQALVLWTAARERNAHERCRRFRSAPLSLTEKQALAHVEARAEDLAQVRPEYGHATNAVCVVARRDRTKHLFMDRRAFLMSYDPTHDDAEASILAGILAAVAPVCAGINLEYYFSFVDPTGWGCGTKLPHNITSLLGVMDGAASDLRPGLPWQMVEIHEPVRCLFIVETTPAAMTAIMDRNPTIGRLCRNRWVQLAVLDPDSDAMQVLGNSGFERFDCEDRSLPLVASSIDWYRGWRDHLGYAEIQRPATSATR